MAEDFMRYREYIPGPELSSFVRYFWAFEKKPEDTLFKRDIFFPEVDSIMVFQVKGAVCVETDEGTGPISGETAVLAGAKKCVNAFFPGEHLLVGMALKPGAATHLGLFSPQDVRGVASLDFNTSTRVIELCRDIPQGSDLSALFGPVKEYLHQRIRQRSERINRNQVSVLESLPPFGSKLSSAAEAGGLSLRQIERLSLFNTGYTPRQFTALKACSMARKMIFTQTYSTLSDLALQLGFYDQPHFCKVFKRWCGMSPSEYNRYFAPFRNIVTGKNRMFTYQNRKTA